ncbi:hypothetical protein [Paenibacillus sp. sgz302251]|uniref:hypothetical protein n=1 Tax=Paenibacillus sp. sgz302251 TaxID=3414493 RepID=UPI003C7A3EA3
MSEITIDHFALGTAVTSAAEMAELAGMSFAITNRVPGTAGDAFDWLSWYFAWVTAAGLETEVVTPTELKAEAADSFEATIPWEQLEMAAVLYALEGEPLPSSGPIRLYVPNGSSKCLNVKSIVKLTIGHKADGGAEEAAYGFKSTFSAAELRMKK